MADQHKLKIALIFSAMRHFADELALISSFAVMVQVNPDYERLRRASSRRILQAWKLRGSSGARQRPSSRTIWFNMPLYYLHVLSGEGPEFDMEGVEYCDIEQARLGAKRAAREILADMIRSGTLIDQHRFEMIDESNNVVISIPWRALIQLD